VFLAAGHVASGRLSAAELTEMSANAVLSPGVCAGIGTANTMHLACEALGILWTRTPANYESYSGVEAAMETINPDGTATLYKSPCEPKAEDQNLTADLERTVSFAPSVRPSPDPGQPARAG
jgi:hypothetical protein